MTISVNYQKRKNTNLFNQFQTNKNINLTNVQNYIPIYDRFFSLNNTNWNAINLNHQWSISDIKDSKKKKNDDENEHVFTCKLKNINDDDDFTTTQNVFIKMAPLLDPFKYVVGKYNHTDPQLFNLPSFDKTAKIHPKLDDPNNSAFVDGFFSFLSSKLLHEHKFIHGLDYYGSFLAIKNDYKINIIDDIDYLIQSEFFVKQQNVLFKVEDYTHLITNNDPKPLQPLKISSSLKSVASITSIDESIFENIFENTFEKNTFEKNTFEKNEKNTFEKNEKNTFEKNTIETHISLIDVKNLGVDLVDITNSSEFDVTNQKKTESLKSGSTCSSRTSHTNDNELSDSDSDSNQEDELQSDNINSDTKDDTKDGNADEECEDEESESSIEEETLTLTFSKFPVQVICMEQCENTFDYLIMNGELTDDEWFSALMQIIMILITYQKMFLFTHNDLHTNNVMYIPTNKKFIYYTFKKQTYKVPTFGKIYKIIDFGRAIYKLNGKILCSDSFKTGGDAATQYNTEPYFNDKKPRLEPNYSFDLCRLACSIFDYVVDDFETIKNINECSPLVKLIVEWCVDDNGVNVLYKNNGVERYPDFKLYKMIARFVHKHTPVDQLDRKEFSKFIVSNKNIGKNETIINIDELPSYY